MPEIQRFALTQQSHLKKGFRYRQNFRSSVVQQSIGRTDASQNITMAHNFEFEFGWRYSLAIQRIEKFCIQIIVKHSYKTELNYCSG